MVGDRPLACVLGDMDLVRPLAIAGIRCAVVAERGSSTTDSRFVDHVITTGHHGLGDERLVDRLVDFGEAQDEPPVLYYQRDVHALLVSRHRHRLGRAFRIVIADADHVEGLLDKVRFSKLAGALELPVPATVVLDTSRPIPDGLPYPLIVKPPNRGDGGWARLGERGKAVRVDDRRELEASWPRWRGLGTELVAQELVEGPESRIESYHAYVDATGAPVGEFTARKLRTQPREYGFTTAGVITCAPDVIGLGRRVMHALGITGVAKIDFKRTPDGELRLLEVNPRFNLWHHPGAVAGVNLPALVWADLTGRPRPPVRSPRSGVRWCSAHDRHPAREAGQSLPAWAAWALRCEAKSNFSWDDPALVYRRAWRALRRGRR